MEEKDVSAQVKREDYEAMIQPLIARLTAPLVEALGNSGLSIEDIDAVEIVGGSTRIPQVKEKLTAFFGENKLQTTLNQDEAVARGCALQCAVLSPVLKVRDFTVNDWNGFPIQFSWDSSLIHQSKDGVIADNIIEAFPIANLVPSSKVLTLTRKMDAAELAAGKGTVEFKISADYTDGIYARGASKGNGTHIANWTIKGIKHHAALAGDIAPVNGPENKANIRIKARLDGNNIVHVDSAQLLVDVCVPVVEEKKKDERKKQKPMQQPLKKALKRQLNPLQRHQ